MNTLAIDPLLIFWFISFLLSFPIPSNPKSLLFPILSSFLNPEFAFKDSYAEIPLTRSGMTRKEWWYDVVAISCNRVSSKVRLQS
ncbi:hypothetical protein [Wolbachia endosymbiont (group B) of Ennomos erosarius]|uniref:hypothetical protein n=1 Tax=Wolbachia endosymbiont (group B) of Ennomos erosarius TaxID=3066175 RepID=UPI003132A724